MTNDLERRLRAVESSGLPSMEKGVTTCWHRNPDGPEAADEIARLHDRLAEEQMLATKWMEAHDKLKAGKPYTFPTPADLPNGIARLRVENQALREALGPFVEGACHTQVFLCSRQKMHPAGQALYQEDVDRARQALQEGSRHE